MSQLITRSQIKPLSIELANQIAAGEVIERPASVLKELIENALDAGATRVDIELVNGGMDTISVKDNGSGIHADELDLAMSRHATSKITCSDDLRQLTSLGFRGEALASISSISQWEMISRTADAKAAAKVSYEFPDEPVEVNHEPGTHIRIRKLFFNTPARRKFLKSERTELRHCEEVIKRLALSNFSAGFYVQHNERQIMRLPAVNDDVGRTRRISQICGQQFIKQSINLEFPYQNMRLWGWISQPSFSRQSTDLQYFFINGRIIRDRIINHAIRSAYQAFLPQGRHAAYVLTLQMPAEDVDVNVHPTKHEVRFRESRMIHDFISRSIRHALSGGPVTSTTMEYPQHATMNYEMAKVSEHPVSYLFETSNSDASFPGELREVLFNRFALTRYNSQYLLIDLQILSAHWIASEFAEQQKENVAALPLLIPQNIELEPAQILRYDELKDKLEKAGFDIQRQTENRLLIRKVPTCLRGYQQDEVLLGLFSEMESKQNLNDNLSDLMLRTIYVLQPDLERISVNGLLRFLSEDPQLCVNAWRELDQTTLLALLQKK